jgi:LCP family protein required for cell wall assembly
MSWSPTGAERARLRPDDARQRGPTGGWRSPDHPAPQGYAPANGGPPVAARPPSRPVDGRRAGTGDSGRFANRSPRRGRVNEPGRPGLPTGSWTPDNGNRPPTGTRPAPRTGAPPPTATGRRRAPDPPASSGPWPDTGRTGTAPPTTNGGVHHGAAEARFGPTGRPRRADQDVPLRPVNGRSDAQRPVNGRAAHPPAPAGSPHEGRSPGRPAFRYDAGPQPPGPAVLPTNGRRRSAPDDGPRRADGLPGNGHRPPTDGPRPTGAPPTNGTSAAEGPRANGAIPGANPDAGERRRARAVEPPAADEHGGRRRSARPADDANPIADEPPSDDADPIADEQPRTGRRRGRKRTDPGSRAVGTSGTGRSVARARAEARTAKVAPRGGPTDDGDPGDDPADDEAGTAKVPPRRSRSSEPDEERLRADRIDETLTRLTAAHAGLVLGRHDEDEDEDEEEEAPPKRTRPTVRLGRYAVAAVALLLVLVAGTGWVGRTRLDGALTQVAAVDVAADGVVDAAAQTGDENVLVLAIDSGGSAGATTRANTVTVVHRDARDDRTVAVTLPPRLEITRPPCERFDPAAATYLGQTVPAEPRTTFESAYAVGGPRCATRAAQQVTGLAITRFVAVDLAATSALVESVGGVQVCVERPVIDSVLGPIAATAGADAFNGARAATLVRAADVRDEPAGGAALVQRQQRVLAAALERALAPGFLLHPGRVGAVAPALGTTVVSTGTGVADLLALSHAAGEVRAVPTEPQANSRGNVELQETGAQALFTAVRTDAPLPAQEATASAAPTDVTADVLNASGRDGLAAEVAGTLGDLGFRTAEVRNADQPALDTVVRFSPDRAEQAQLLAAAVPSANTVPDPGTTGVLQLVLGRSFDGTVRASTAPEPVAEAATAPAATCG